MLAMKKPAFQFYVQDFLTGTLFFTAEETGAYIRLLCYQWDKGFIPDNEKLLAKITGAKKRPLENVLVKFTKSTEGHFVNDKLERVRKSQEEYSKRQSANGLKGGRPPKPNETQPLPKLKAKRKAKRYPKKALLLLLLLHLQIQMLM
jgi:uncharacterized protein YdaU (DUF1376 family)